jgi:arginine utilization regulatory protein
VPLAKFFVESFNRKLNKSVKEIQPEVFEYLRSCYWQGNVRELQNYIERAMILKKNEVLRLNDFAENFLPKLHNENGALIKLQIEPDQNKNLLHEIQKNLILYTLEVTQNNISRAAKFLGIPRTSLSSCMDRFGIKKGT